MLSIVVHLPLMTLRLSLPHMTKHYVFGYVRVSNPGLIKGSKNFSLQLFGSTFLFRVCCI